MVVYIMKPSICLKTFRSRDQDSFIGLICSETQSLPTIELDIELATIPT